MKIGWYYHAEFVEDELGVARIPAHLGLFLRTLAETAGHVTYYSHRGTGAGNEDFGLTEPYVSVRDLGPAGSHPRRTFLPGRFLSRFDPQADGIDVMVVHGPTALLPHFSRVLAEIPTAFLLWGDYSLWQPPRGFPRWRTTLVRLWIRAYSQMQQTATRGRLVMVNSPALEETARSARVVTVPMSSMPASVVPAVGLTDVTWSPTKGNRDPVRLIYAGRINRRKGIFEAVESLRILEDRGYHVTLELVGWEEPADPTIEALHRHIEAFAVAHRVRFRGYHPAGEQLLSVLAEADIFVIPTYWESLPRSMLEAMAVGLPTIATPVGGILHYLRDHETALLVPPKDPVALADAIQELIDDPDVRRTIAAGGREWASRMTIEASCEAIVEQLGLMMGDASHGDRQHG